MEGSLWLCIYHLCASSRYLHLEDGLCNCPQMQCETMEILCLQTMNFFFFFLSCFSFPTFPCYNTFELFHEFLNVNNIYIYILFLFAIGAFLASHTSQSLRGAPCVTCHSFVFHHCVYTSNFLVPIMLKLARFWLLLCGALLSVICTQIICPNWIGMWQLRKSKYPYKPLDLGKCFV